MDMSVCVVGVVTFATQPCRVDRAFGSTTLVMVCFGCTLGFILRGVAKLLRGFWGKQCLLKAII